MLKINRLLGWIIGIFLAITPRRLCFFFHHLGEKKAEEDYDKINLTKLNLIEHGHFKNPLLAGIAVGLRSQIYDAGGKD